MDGFFRRCLWLTDLHFGRSGNSAAANQDNLDFLAWAIDRGRSWGAETLIMGGDWHDNRHQLEVATLHASLAGLEMVNAAFQRCIFLPGNHDLFYRSRRDVSSIAFAKYLDNIEIIREPCSRDDVTFLPWLVGDEYQTAAACRSRYVFGHLEMPGFMMNARVELPDNPRLLHAEQFGDVDAVYTGHFHLRQQRGRVVYTGNVMPFDFGDANDSARGLMLLAWGGEPQFEAWPEQPLYRTLALSSLRERAGEVLRPKMTVRATVDLSLDYEATQDLRNTLVQRHGLRKIELQAPPPQPLVPDTVLDVAEQSLDQIVEQGLRAIESSELSAERLIDIYRLLGDGAADPMAPDAMAPDAMAHGTMAHDRAVPGR